MKWILFLFLFDAHGEAIQITTAEFKNFESCGAALYQLAPGGQTRTAGTCVAYNWKDPQAVRQ